MTSPATVTIAGPARADFARSQRAIWASLPISLTEDSSEARLIAIDGCSAGWLDVLADVIRPSVAGVMIVRPAAGPSARDIRVVAGAAAESGTIVVVETAWASNPPVAELAHAAARQVLDIRLVNSLAEMAADFPGQWADVLLDHLTLLRAMTGPLAASKFATHNATGYTVYGVTGVSTVAMSAVRSAVSQPNVRMAAYGVEAEAHLVVPTGGTAAPAAAWIVTQSGATVQPTRYETASRASWRRLHAAAERPGEPLPDLLDLADDTDLVAAITASWQA